MPKSKIIKSLSLISFVGILVFIFLESTHKKTESFSTLNKIGTVKKGDLIQNVTVAGTVFPIRKTTYAPPYNAYVKKIYVKLGQKVKKGDPVVSLEQSLGGVHENVFPMRAPFDGTVVQILHGEGEYV